MKRTQMHNSQTDPGKIDHILATEQELIPSSGFLASVMERVQDEARTPAPIAFPWKRAIPGILLATGVFGWGAVELVQFAVPAARALSFTQPQLSASLSRPIEETGWVAFAFVVSLISWLLSRRLAGQSDSL